MTKLRPVHPNLIAGSYLTIFVLVFWATLGLIGFNPTDDGFILAQSWRVLNGQIPHVDFTSPRPAGSAILHLLDVLSPFGTFAISRLFVSTQLVFIAWGSVKILAAQHLPVMTQLLIVTSAFFLNVGIWPIMAWHTIDGLFLSILAAVIILFGRPNWMTYSVAWFVAGSAILMKQGFIVAPVIVLLLSIQSKRWRSIPWFGFSFLPVILFAIWTKDAPFGVFNQLSSGSMSQYVAPFLSMVEQFRHPSTILSFMIVFGVFCYLLFHPSVKPRTRLFLGLVAILPSLIMVARNQMSMGSEAPIQAFTEFCLAGIYVAFKRGNYLAFASIGLLAYGISMSWGVPNPSLLTGTLVAGIFIAVAFSPNVSVIQTRRSIAVMLTVTILLGSGFTTARLMRGYREAPGQVPQSVSAVPGFALLRMNESTVEYLAAAQTCIQEFPADQTALIPGGAALYPGMRITNPFHMDWWLPAEKTANEHEWLTKDIANITSTKQHTLILFQTFLLDHLASTPLPGAQHRTKPMSYDESDTKLLEELHGTPVNCDYFIGVRVEN